MALKEAANLAKDRASNVIALLEQVVEGILVTYELASRFGQALAKPDLAWGIDKGVLARLQNQSG